MRRAAPLDRPSSGATWCPRYRDGERQRVCDDHSTLPEWLAQLRGQVGNAKRASAP
jgi:hypothetical protein